MKTKKAYIAPALSVEYYSTELGYAASKWLQLEFDFLDDGSNQEQWGDDENLAGGENDIIWL
jgi:hypothetical protein